MSPEEEIFFILFFYSHTIPNRVSHFSINMASLYFVVSFTTALFKYFIKGLEMYSVLEVGQDMAV